MAFAGVGEADVVKFDTAVSDSIEGFFGGRKFRRFRQHFGDTHRRGPGHDDHHKDHGEHHQAHENLHDVGNHTHQLPGGEGSGDDELRSEPGNGDHGAVDHKGHQRAAEHQQFFRPGGEIVEIIGGLGEFSVFVVFADEGLHHPHRLKIFLYHIVESVVGAEHFREQRMGSRHDEIETDP